MYALVLELSGLWSMKKTRETEVHLEHALCGGTLAERSVRMGLRWMSGAFES